MKTSAPGRRFVFAPLLAMTGLLSQVGLAYPQTESKAIYPAPEKASSQIKTALAKAHHDRKRIILDFGGNWCGDCVALDRYFHMSPNAKLLKENFLLVHVNIGQFDKNKDIAKTYGVPLEKGVPALAVLDWNGRLLFSQKQGEFESMRRLDVGSVTEFLNQWKK